MDKQMDTSEEKSPVQWALDVLEPTETDYTESFFKYYILPPSVLWGIYTIRARNMSLGRPRYFNLPSILLMGVVTGFAGYCMQHIFFIRKARRYAVMRDYISQHPERFPDITKPTYRDLLLPWLPIR